jgi:preprotein translocase subunit SecF
MELIKPGTKIDFVGRRRLFVGISLAVIFASLIGIFISPGPNWGIDFKGGTEIDVKFTAPIKIEELRNAVESLHLGDVKIQSVNEAGAESQTNFLIRMEQLTEEEPLPTKAEKSGEPTPAASPTDQKAAGDKAGIVAAKLTEVFGPDSFEITKSDTVGPRVGKELRNKSVMAIVYAIAMLLVYIALRFELKYAIGAILALIHDVIITTGAFVFSQKEFNLPIIAALLTIVGYSLNDTIVVFDRVRENLRRMRKLEFNDMVNVSVNETLSRTLLTAGTTLITVFFLWWLGGGVIQDFAFALMVGIIVGTYSSIFIASAFVIEWEARKAKGRSPAAVEKKPT